MSMEKLVDSLLSKPKNERDTFTKEEKKETLKIYKKRIEFWDSHFDKVRNEIILLQSLNLFIVLTFI